MPPRQQTCYFGTCSHACTKTNHRTNYFRAHPDGYPKSDGLYKCAECKGMFPKSPDLHVDHRKPKTPNGEFTHGGTNCQKNLQAMCGTCNRRKQNDYNFRDKVTSKIPNKIRKHFGW